MKESVMKEWVKALRSGGYKQGRDRLVDNDDKFCCLGVLCNIAPDSLGLDWKYIEDTWTIGGNDIELPLVVRVWAGMNSSEGHLDHDMSNLSDLNDDGKSFIDIANHIEKNWDKL